MVAQGERRCRLVAAIINRRGQVRTNTDRRFFLVLARFFFGSGEMFSRITRMRFELKPSCSTCYKRPAY
jgi:hypothetical protein